MAHMLPAPVPDCFHRNLVVSVRAALGRGIEILVHLDTQIEYVQILSTVTDVQ